MSEVSIRAASRSEFGKGFARRTRRAGQVPAVLYGHGEAPRHVALPARELMHAFKGDAGANVLLRLELDEGSELALPRQIQRDPIRGDLTHVDLLLVRRGERVSVEVPVVVVGEARGVKEDAGVLDHVLTTLNVEAEATNIPQQVEVDVTAMRVGDHVNAAQVTLPGDVTLLTDPEALVLHIVGQAAEEPEAEVAAVEGEPAEGDGGDAAEAPAEGE